MAVLFIIVVQHVFKRIGDLENEY